MIDDETRKFYRGLFFGVLFSIPLWAGVYLTTTWIITR